MKKPTAYFLLDKMAAAGWITQEQSQVGNRPPRRVYRITAKGEAEFQRMLHQNLASHIPVVFPTDIGLAFVDALDRADALELLAQRRAALSRALNEAQAVPEHSGSLQLVVEHRIRHLAAELDWLDEVITRLRKKAGRAAKAKKQANG